MGRSNRWSRRTFLTRAGAAGLGLALPAGSGVAAAGWHGQPAVTARMADQVKLSYMCWELYPGQADNERKTLIEPFEKKFPSISIDNSTVSGYDAYWQKVQTLYVTGKAPDVYGMSVGYEWDFAHDKKIIDLNDRIEKEIPADQYFTDVLPILRYPNPKGRLFAFPFEWVCSVLYYNIDLFDKAKVKYPDETWTWETLRDAAKELTGKGQFGFASNSAHTQLDSTIYANGGQVLNDAYTKCVLAENPEAIDTIQWFVDLIYKDKVAPTADESASIGLSTSNGPFQSGKVAMVVDGSYQISTTRGVGFDWDIAMVPKGKVKRVIYGGPDSYSISSKTDHVDQAWEFLKYAVGPARTVASFSPGVVPIYKATANSDAWLEKGQKPANKKVILDSEPYLMGAEFISKHWSEWRITAMNNDLAAAFLGKESVKDAVKKATDDINAILAKP